MASSFPATPLPATPLAAARDKRGCNALLHVAIEKDLCLLDRDVERTKPHHEFAGHAAGQAGHDVEGVRGAQDDEIDLRAQGSCVAPLKELCWEPEVLGECQRNIGMRLVDQLGDRLAPYPRHLGLRALPTTHRERLHADPLAELTLRDPKNLSCPRYGKARLCKFVSHAHERNESERG